MNKKILLAFVILSILVAQVFLLVGCDNNDYDPNNFIDDVTSEKIVKEKITIKLFVPRSQQHAQDWNTMRLFQELEEETNIHIEFSYGDVSSYTNQKSAALASSRNKPDAYFLWNTVSEQTIEASLGTIMAIDDLIDEYAPNYKALMEQNPEMKQRATLLDGKMYSTVIINTVPRDWTFKQYINVKWIYQAMVNEYLLPSDLGLTSIPNYDDQNERALLLPKTTEQFYKVLQAFKTMGKIPLSGIGYSSDTRAFLMSAFGFVTSGISLDSNGNVIFVQNTDNYREYLKYASKLYSEGLIDNTIYSNASESAFYAKSDSLACFCASSAYSVVGPERDGDYMALAPLTSPINSTQMWLDYDNKFDPTGLMISSDTPYYREIMRWIDRLYTKKYAQIQAVGKEGVDWEWDDDEQTSYTFLVPDGQTIEQYRGTLTPGVGLGQVAYWDGDFVLKDNNPYTSKINEEVKTYLDYLVVPFPAVKFTTKEAEALSFIDLSINTAASDFEKLVITGDSKHNINDDSVWNSYQETLKKLNIEGYINYYKTAYQRYLEQ